MRLLLACLFTLLLSACDGEGSSVPDPVPVPSVPATPELPLAPPRKRLCYFGALDPAFLSHVNLSFANQWGNVSPAGVVADVTLAQQAGLDAVILCPPIELFPNGKYLGSVASLKPTLDALDQAGLLPLVKYFYPKDEPDGSGVSEADLRQCNADLRALLPGTRIFVIYGEHGTPAIDDYDVIGMDVYSAGTDILNGTYQALASNLQPHQTLALVPGCADGVGTQAIQPWLDYLLASPRAEILCIFLWTDQWGGTQNLGVASNSRHDECVAAGDQVRSISS